VVFFSVDFLWRPDPSTPLRFAQDDRGQACYFHPSLLTGWLTPKIWRTSRLSEFKIWNFIFEKTNPAKVLAGLNAKRIANGLGGTAKPRHQLSYRQI